MKKIFGFLFLSFSLLWSVGFADLAGYTISHYDVEMTLHEDGSMDVQETLAVHFSEARHGIYRTIPYYNNSNRYTVIEYLQAVGDQYASYTEENTYQLRIGNPDATLIGPHQYVIKYRVKNAIAGFSDWTEFYRNVIGTDWNTTIDKVNFMLHLPKENSFNSGDYYLVYGKQGEKKSEGSQLSLSGTTFIGTLDKGLFHYEGLTLGVKFPQEGYFALTEEYENIQAPQSSMNSIKHTYEPYSDDIFLFFSLKDIILWLLGICFIGYLIRGIINSFKKKPSTAQPKNKKESFIIFCFILFSLILIIMFSISPILILFLLILLGVSIGVGFIINTPFVIKQHYKPDKPITIHYTPPKDIDILIIAQIYNVIDSQVVSALIYYWATQGYISIEEEMRQVLFFFRSYPYILHKGKNFSLATGIHQILLIKLLTGQEDFCLSEFDYSFFTSYKNIVLKQTKTTRDLYYIKEEKKFLGLIPYITQVLNEQGQQLYEEIRGFEYYLNKVERSYLEQMLQDDPDYIDKMFPWAVLFGVETTFLQTVEEILGKTYAPKWYSGDIAFSAMTISMVSHSATTPPSSGGSGGSGGGGSSGFSGGGGSSGGGGGGGGGGSW